MRYGCVSADGDEVSFPRGGASALTPLEYRQVRREAEESVLYGDDEDDEVDKKVACSHVPSPLAGPHASENVMRATG
jgi:hypothetical protein